MTSSNFDVTDEIVVDADVPFLMVVHRIFLADLNFLDEPHDAKKSSHTDTTETRADFCVHAALGRLRFVSGSTAQLTLFG